MSRACPGDRVPAVPGDPEAAVHPSALLRSEAAKEAELLVPRNENGDDVDRFVDELLAAGPGHTAATAYAVDPDEDREFRTMS